MDRMDAKARARRQERVAKVTWGTLFVVMGVLLTLDDMGRIDLGDRHSPFAAAQAVDGDAKTRWSSAFRDPQWLSVDLGTPTALGHVRMEWEAAFARQYELQTSEDGAQWTTVRRVTDGKGGIDDQPLEGTARYVRVLGTTRSTPWGYSLFELQVYDASGHLVSQGKTASASSEEDQGAFLLWVKFWPLLLVAGGLPLLLAPRNDANQVVGIALTAAGTLLELQAFGVLAWGVRLTWAAALIAVGLVILLQAQRRAESAGDDGAGPTGNPS